MLGYHAFSYVVYFITMLVSKYCTVKRIVGELGLDLH